MKTSVKCPKGTPNEWPIEDYTAWEQLMSAALVIMEKQAETATCANDINPAQAFHTAAKSIGLKGRELHWLVDLCLANHYGLFERTYDEKRSKWYMRAETWLQRAPMADLTNTDKHKEAMRQAGAGLTSEQLKKPS